MTNYSSENRDQNVRTVRTPTGWLALTSGNGPRIGTVGETEERAVVALSQEMKRWTVLLTDIAPQGDQAR